MICIDITMPRNCLECPCRNREYGYCQADTNIDACEGISDRPRRCPLVELKESPENDSLIKSAYLIGQMCEKTDCNNCIFKFVDQGKWLSCIVSCRPYDWRRHIEDNFEERRTNDEGRRD